MAGCWSMLADETLSVERYSFSPIFVRFGSTCLYGLMGYVSRFSFSICRLNLHGLCNLLLLTASTSFDVFSCRQTFDTFLGTFPPLSMVLLPDYHSGPVF